MFYNSNGKFKYIYHICNYFLRFFWAKTLTSKRAVEVVAYCSRDAASRGA
jgi:hypothetical protein